jgi:translocation and assembly module TamA
MNYRLLCAVLTLCILCAGIPRSEASWWWPFGVDGVEYDVKFTGISPTTKKWFKELKLDKADDSNLPQTNDEVEQQAVTLAERLQKALNAKGYYDAVIRSRVDMSKKKPVIIYTIQQGPQYRISSIRIEWPGKPLFGIRTKKLTSKVGQAVDAEIIQKDGISLMTAIGKDACLLSLNVSPLLKLHTNRHAAELVFRIAHGMRADFGDTVISGTKDVSNQVILRSVKWKKGDCFDQVQVEKTRDALVQNQLLASVSIKPDTIINAQGQVPMLIDVTERVPRTIKIGGNYSTDQGAGITFGWEHRNFFGNAEKFNTDVTLAQQQQSIDNTLRIPAFLRDDQTLVLNGGIKRENTDAYTTNSITTGAGIERKLWPTLNSGIGIAYTLSKTEDTLAGNSQYGLLSFPGFLEYDTRDNVIDSRKGIYGRFAVTPYTETFGDGGQFLKNQATFQTYFSSDSKYKPTLALRVSGGSINGSKGNDIPSDIRFYAGGGGSVRGYSYQSLGPQLAGESIGGSSMLVGSTELRFRFTDTIGAVAFVDAGNAYSTTLPDLNEIMYYGAGVGARYYTPIGPLRIDVAVPLNGDKIGQNGYALYVSLGQSF